ncbi:MAG: hypothetical protein U9O53_05845 [archaeon]|nr:hypothetical protein [archaeon]
MDELSPDNGTGATVREKIAQLIYDVVLDSEKSVDPVKSNGLVDSVFDAYSDEKAYSFMLLSRVYGDSVTFGKSEGDLCFFEEFPYSKFRLYLSKNPLTKKRRLRVDRIMDDGNSCYIYSCLKLAG